jgi:hypothetical protein
MAILQVNFRWELPVHEQEALDTAEGAEKLAELPGLQWKVWLRDEETQRAGGIYHFTDRESARAWGDGPLREAIAGLPGTSELEVRYFDERQPHSSITRAPLGELAQRP